MELELTEQAQRTINKILEGKAEQGNCLVELHTSITPVAFCGTVQQVKDGMCILKDKSKTMHIPVCIVRVVTEKESNS
jgi:hypothetical protein